MVDRESRQIAERKQELLEQCLRIARSAANRIEDNIDKFPVGQLIPAYSVAADEILRFYRPIRSTRIERNLHFHLQSHDIAREFNEMLAQDFHAAHGLTSKRR